MDLFLDFFNDLLKDDFENLKSSDNVIDYAFDKIDSIEDFQQNMHRFLSDHKTKKSKDLLKSQDYRERGNLQLKKKNYEYALYFYNLAVMSAPYPSDTNDDFDEELSFAFTSRSLTFFQMECYENALFDINSALQMSTSLKFDDRLELMLHKVYCLHYLGKNSESKQLIQKMVDLIPCLPINNGLVEDLIRLNDSISDKSYEVKTTPNDFEIIAEMCKNRESYIHSSCQLSSTQQKGRYFISDNKIPKLEIVMVDESYSAILFRMHFKTHCQNCHKNIGYNYWPCSQCNEVVFCDEECAEEAYYHKYECGLANLLGSFEATHYLSFRILSDIGPQNAINYAKHQSFDSENNNDFNEKISNYLKFLRLKDHVERSDLETKTLSTIHSIQLAIVLNFVYEFDYKGVDYLQNIKDLAMVLESNNYKILINGFGMYEQKIKCRPYRGQHTGNAVCLKPSFFNHSCDPNLFWLFNGKHITLMTTREVKAGEDLTISYGPYSGDMAFNERQDLLQKRYHFRCNCFACIKDAKDMPTLKCNNCGEGLLLYESDSTESSCLICNKEYKISFIVKRVEEIEESFDYWIQEFESLFGKTTDSELFLINAENYYKDFCTFLYSKSQKMLTINRKLSRSFESLGNYFKAMFYSRKTLESFTDFENPLYCIEMVSFSRLFYQHLHKRNSFIKDNDWEQCFEVISETILILKKCKKRLLTVFEDETSNSDEFKFTEKRIRVIENLLVDKEKQICFILGLNKY